MVLSCVRQWFKDTAALRVFWSVVVLDLSAVELISFPVARTGLYFEHRAYNTELFLLCSHRAKPFLAFHTAMLVRRLGVHGRLGTAGPT